MTSRLIVNSVRHTGASADGITMAADGSVHLPWKCYMLRNGYRVRRWQSSSNTADSKKLTQLVKVVLLVFLQVQFIYL